MEWLTNDVRLTVGLILLGCILAVMVIRARTQGMNVPRDRRPRRVPRYDGELPFLYYEDLTPDERRANGFIPTDELPHDMQIFMKRQPSDELPPELKDKYKKLNP